MAGVMVLVAASAAGAGGSRFSRCRSRSACFGQTDQPEAIETYNILNLVGDIVGLVNALGEESAVVVGHDWGARVAWNCALMRNDLFRGLGLLSDPYVPRGPVRPTVVFEQITKDKNFYQAYFQEPGKVERELEEDVHRTMLGVLYGGSGDASAEQRFKFLFDKNQRFVDTFVLQEKLPPWLTQQDLNFFTSQFKQSGFRGGVNWYRNIDRNWELTGRSSTAQKLFNPRYLPRAIATS
jgi:pimeloyl-ACP methyl ester carboxylesterase